MHNQSTETKYQNDYKSILIRSLASAVFAIILSVLTLFVLAAVLYFKPVNENILSLISIISKYFCAVVAAFISCANKKRSGYLRGAMAAVVYIVLGGILFYSVSIESFTISSLFYDILIASILGMIAGAVAVNINSSSK